MLEDAGAACPVVEVIVLHEVGDHGMPILGPSAAVAVDRLVIVVIGRQVGSGTARGVRGLLLDADGRVRGLAAVILIM